MDELLEAVTDDAGPPLVILAGPGGSGRTTALVALRGALDARGVRVVPLRFGPGAVAVSGPLALPAAGRAPTHPAPEQFAPPWSPIGPAEGARLDPGTAARAGAAAAAPLLVTGRAVLVVDDAQWIDPDSLAVLEALVRRVAGTTVRCVCAIRTPVPGPGGAAGRTAVAGLRADGLVRSVRLRALDADEVAHRLRSALLPAHAVPEPALVARVLELSRGLPAAVDDAVESLRRGGAVQVVDRHAYLVRGPGPAVERHDHHLLRAIRQSGPDVWTAAKAVAVLHPLGPAVPALVARSLGVDAARASALLHRLCADGVLHRGRSGASWRFTVPLVAVALAERLGPYERRQLSACAVEALWDGTAGCADPDYPADRVADAGRLVDVERARTELVRRAGAAMGSDPERAERWWRSAAELSDDRADRAHALLMHAVTCFLHGDYERTRHSAATLLHDHHDRLGPDALQDVQVLLVCATHNVGDTEGLQEVAAGRRLVPGAGGSRLVAQAIALSLQDRWGDARRLLSATRPAWALTPATTALGELFETTADLWTGHPASFVRRLHDRSSLPAGADEQTRVHHVNALVTVLLVLGDLVAAQRLLQEEGVAVDRLNQSDQAVLAMARGEVDTGFDLSRRCVAEATSRGHDVGRASVCRTAAHLLVARGQLNRARDLVASARAARPMHAHLLDVPDAEIDAVLGDHDGAVRRLTATLRATSERGVFVGVELAWSQLAELALDRGDHAAAKDHLVEVERVAEAMGSTRTEASALLLRAVVHGDRGAGQEGLRVSRERAQPFELAVALTRLVHRGVGDPATLREAYDLFGGLGALLHRAWTRNLMWEHDVPIPGRSVTVAENERLLAVLVADGLGNRQLAAVLGTSEKSVEGRLSRLFARTGLRSRIELSAAILTGDHDL